MLEAIYNLYRPELLRYALKHAGEEGPDILQNVFVEYLSKTDVRSPKALLYRILKCRIIDWHRRRKPQVLQGEPAAPVDVRLLLIE